MMKGNREKSSVKNPTRLFSSMLWCAPLEHLLHEILIVHSSIIPNIMVTPSVALSGQMHVRKLHTHTCHPNTSPHGLHPPILNCGEKLASHTTTITRRDLLLAATLLVPLLVADPTTATAATATSTEELERAAAEAYATRDFASAVQNINTLISRDPRNPRLREMAAQALVDGKNFDGAITQFNEALKLLGDEGGVQDTSRLIDKARILSGRGLALEGVADWVGALQDYNAALSIASSLGLDPDPYIVNARGNCHASLGEWKAAREDFLASADGFQLARREGGGAGRLQQRLDGAIYAFSNASLMLAQLGQDDQATREMQSIARRAPGSVDMRAALAAQFWAAGQEDEAEAEWEFACSSIAVGCSKYQDVDWLARVRRWPPVMVERLQAFLTIRSNSDALIVAASSDKKKRQASPRRYSGFKE